MNLTQKQKDVRILRHTDAPKQCEELHHVYASGHIMNSEQDREDQIKRETSNHGGDLAVLTYRNSSDSMFGVAYRCELK